MLTSALERRLLIERFGDGVPTVVALHGWARGRQDWAAVCAGLDALAPDLPGFGLSPEPPSAWGAEQYADFIAPVVDELDRPVLVGHSFGGRVAVQLAANPTRALRGLVLTGVPLLRPSGARRPPPPRAAYRLARRLHTMGLLGEGAMESLRQRYGSADYRNAAGVMRQVLVRVVNETYDDEIRRVRCPVVLVWGESDTAAPVEVARRAEAMFPAATLHVVKGSGHLLDGSLSTRLREEIAGLLDQ